MERRHEYLLLACSCLFVGAFAWFAWLAVVAAELALHLEAVLRSFVAASGQTLGHLEFEVPRQTQQRQRRAAEAAAQAEADASRLAPRCATTLLSRLAHGHQRTFRTRFGPVSLWRARGWCRRCKKWRFAADAVLPLGDNAGSSAAVQELAAPSASTVHRQTWRLG